MKNPLETIEMCQPGWNNDDQLAESENESTAEIPTSINEVSLEFAPTVNRSVDQRVIDGLLHCIKKNVAAGHTLSTIWISSANDSHALPSRHAQGRAVDISRINGNKIVLTYGSDASVKAIVDAIQNAFEGFAYRRENFGPLFKKKLGQPYPMAPDHNDHIHLSVD